MPTGPSAKCGVRYGSESDDMRMITASFMRMLHKCTGSLYMYFNPIFNRVARWATLAISCLPIGANTGCESPRAVSVWSFWYAAPKKSLAARGLPMVGSHGLSVSAVSEPASGCENRRMALKWAHGRSALRVFRGVNTGHLPSRGGHAWATMVGQSAKGMARWDSAYDTMASSLAVCLVNSRGVRVPSVRLFSSYCKR
jgi:hypothetical protein